MPSGSDAQAIADAADEFHQEELRADVRRVLGLPQETTEDQGLAMQEVFQEMDVDESGGVGFAELAKFVRRVKTARAAGAVSSGDGH